MNSLKVRKIPFQFNGVEFIWNPDNPGFSIAMNTLSFFVIGLERYFCQATQAAIPLIREPRVKEEALLFMAQEAAHSLAHRRHVTALIERYPGLQEALDQINEHFNKLYKEKELAYHLGYAGGLESIFTPFFKLLLDNRDHLFAGGDIRVSSLFLWHFCEEIEHRQSAIMIYDDVVGSYYFRIKNFMSFMRHVTEGLDLIERKFKEHIPDVPGRYYVKHFMVEDLPFLDRLRTAWWVFLSQMPWAKPQHQRVPDYYFEWLRLDESGADLTKVYGVGAEESAVGCR
jgi:predicted metal-dependent hydrolase